MSNMLIVYRNYLDAAILSGGNWSSGLPLDNLAHPHPSRVARSTDTDPVSSCFEVDFGAQRPSSFSGILNHNLSQRGTWRIRLFNRSLDQPELDTGAVPIWPALCRSALGIGVNSSGVAISTLRRRRHTVLAPMPSCPPHGACAMRVWIWRTLIIPPGICKRDAPFWHQLGRRA